MDELDVSKGSSQDLLIDSVWDRCRNDFKKGDYNCCIITPCCSTFSRAPFANDEGPKPLRSAEYPEGFPWLTGDRAAKAAEGTLLLERAKILLGDALDLKIPCLFEFPEDLGRRPAGTPASPFQDGAFRKRVEKAGGKTTVAFRCKESSTSCYFASLVCSSKNLDSSLAHMQLPSTTFCSMSPTFGTEPLVVTPKAPFFAQKSSASLRTPA